MKFRPYILILIILILQFELISQRLIDVDLQQIIESQYNTQEELPNQEELYERLLLIYENPVYINTATQDELQRLFMLSVQQILSLQKYINAYGRLLTKYELQLIDGFDPTTIDRVLPFIIINPEDLKKDTRPLLKRVLSERNNYFIFRLQQNIERKRGFQPNIIGTNSMYNGSASKIYLRYRVAKTGDFSFGFTAEKDAGEELIWKPNTGRFGADFWSGHIMKENIGRWKKIIVGDYQLQFGQGLLFGAGLNTGKGAATVSGIQKPNLGIRPYTSVLESGYLRGLAASYQVRKNTTVTGFVSHSLLDAELKPLANDSVQSFVSSISNTGLHRTLSEISKKHRMSESTYGLILDHRPNDFKRFGIIAAANNYSVPIIPSNVLYNKFAFQGDYNYNLSLYGNYNWRQFSFFGESGMSRSGGFGSIFGLTTHLSERIDFALVFRSYERDFHTQKGTSFAEGSQNRNESGTYWGVKYRLNNQFYFTAYYDTFRFPWLRFQVDAPSSGFDYMLRFNYTPSKYFQTVLQYRKKSKAKNATIEGLNEKRVAEGIKQQWLLNSEMKFGFLSLKSRIQYSEYNFQAQQTNGIALIQDAVFKTRIFTISGRVAIFDTEGSENSQYVYERDVLYAFSIPAYSGNGVRNYILVHSRLSRKIDLWTRFSRTTFYDREEIGTGLETIDGQKRSDFKVQVRYKIN
ncbi:hypothetical protein [Roseivirga sp.]|uniref:hypothetical protein n=1 Tax=Roseivirga sp. TaxID=1964215 RepID=UPI003B8B4140